MTAAISKNVEYEIFQFYAGIRHNNEYTNDSFKKKLASFYRLCSKIEGEFFSKAKQKGMELFRFNFSQAATKSYLIYCGASNNTFKNWHRLIHLTSAHLKRNQETIILNILKKKEHRETKRKKKLLYQ